MAPRPARRPFAAALAAGVAPSAPSGRPFGLIGQPSAPERSGARSPSGRPFGLTARQQQILDWIRAFVEASGMPPTRAEIARGLGFSTPSSAEDHLQALARKGALEIRPGASRGLRLREMPGVPVQGTLPLVGRVAAGSPILATGHVEGRYRIDATLFTPAADYLLRVHGDSMVDAGIHEGDLLAVHATAEARSGQIVVARLGGSGGDEVTVKRLRRRGRSILLVPENAAYAPIEIDPQATPLTIEGVGVGVIRTRFG